MTKLTVAFRNFPNAPNNPVYFPCIKATCYTTNSPSVFPYRAALVSSFSRDSVQPTFTRTNEHSLGTFREEHLVFLSSSSAIISPVTLTMGRVSAVESGDQIPVGATFFSPIQTGPGTHSTSHTMGTGSLPGVKRPGRGVDHLPTSSAEVKERVEIHL